MNFWGVDLEKGEQRSNWLARPLRDSQCVYASADVAHLHQAREILLERIGDNAAWLNEELATLDTPGLYAVETPEAYFKRMRKGRSIPARARAILRECVLWRETEAAHRDRPRSPRAQRRYSGGDRSRGAEGVGRPAGCEGIFRTRSATLRQTFVGIGRERSGN